MASEPFEASALVGTGTLNGEPEVADEGAQGSASAGAGGAGGGAAAGSEKVRVDFSSLDALERTSKPAADFEKHLGAEILEASRAIDVMTPYEEVQQRLLEVETEYDAVKASQKEANSSFQNARNQRYSKFMSCFKVISESIDDKYKDLTQTEGVLVGGTAYLSIEDTTEPYLHGIKYTAMPPAKRFRPMMELSGGERTVAALALLFAIWEFRPSPFFVMDEIDAALDNVNVTRVAQYIRERAAEGKIQFVVISLKDTFYHMAHSLVGVYRDRSDESSDVVTLDLESLEQPPGAAEPRRSSGASTSSFRKSLEVK
jgi:structural maintenance of chromosome 1